MGAQNTFFEMLENNTWNDIVKVFESESDFGVQKIRDEINSSNVGSSTLGEGTWGHIYSYTQEDGGLVYKGTGGIDSIAGTSGDDYLHGGNGIDVMMDRDFLMSCLIHLLTKKQLREKDKIFI